MQMKSGAFRLGVALLASMALFSSAHADDRPLALVEYISDAPEAMVSGFDYVYDGDKVDLRPDGSMVVAYFDRCIVETFQGGVVQFRDDGAKISKGGTSDETVRACQTASLAVNTQATTAGASVKREGEADSLLSLSAMKEISTPMERPVFIWPKQISNGRMATITINFLDAEPKQQIWTDQTNDARFAYPEEAPALKRGMPYEIIVSFAGDDAALTTVFSIDPGLDLPASPLTDVIPLGL